MKNIEKKKNKKKDDEIKKELLLLKKNLDELNIFIENWKKVIEEINKEKENKGEN